MSSVSDDMWAVQSYINVHSGIVRSTVTVEGHDVAQIFILCLTASICPVTSYDTRYVDISHVTCINFIISFLACRGASGLRMIAPNKTSLLLLLLLLLLIIVSKLWKWSGRGHMWWYLVTIIISLTHTHIILFI